MYSFRIDPNAPAGQKPAKCIGTNCTSTDGKNHSRECQAEHMRAVGLNPDDYVLKDAQ